MIFFGTFVGAFDKVIFDDKVPDNNKEDKSEVAGIDDGSDNVSSDVIFTDDVSVITDSYGAFVILGCVHPEITTPRKINMINNNLILFIFIPPCNPP
jgi:metal-dependent hydrolase (beta-lactamase superfamily II)